MATLYDTLGVSQTADLETVRRSYRRLARKYHPDINPDPASHDVMARINDAFRVLSDPARRMEYDAMLASGMGVQTEDKPAWTPKAPLLVRLERRIRAHKTPIYGIGFQGPNTLITSSFDNEVCWWDVNSGSRKRREKLESGVVSTLRSVRGNGVVTAGVGQALQAGAVGVRLEDVHVRVEVPLVAAALAQASANAPCRLAAIGPVTLNMTSRQWSGDCA